MGGVLQYKWGAYCSTNGGCTVGFPFFSKLKSQEGAAIQMGAYCRINWRCAAVLSPRSVGVGSGTLLKVERGSALRLVSQELQNDAVIGLVVAAMIHEML